MSATEGWTFEGPDPTVGIFGSVWWHEDCLSWKAEGDPEPFGQQDEDQDGLTVTCGACHASFTLDRPDPEPAWEDR